MISVQDVDFFWEYGYLSPIQIFDDDKIDFYRGLFNDLKLKSDDKRIIGLHYDVPFVKDLAISPKIIETVKFLLGDSVLLLGTHFFCKYPVVDNKNFVCWHQDVTYWGLEPRIVLTVWYAIDDSNVSNGCMRVLPGSHKEGVREHLQIGSEGNMLELGQEATMLDSDKKTSPVNLELRAGEISIHDGSILHSSLTNRSNRRRCGLAVRFVPSFVKLDFERWHPVEV